MQYRFHVCVFSKGMKIDLDSDEIDANIVAGLLKQYLRELPSNLLTPRLQHAFDSLIGMFIFFNSVQFAID